MTTRIERVKQAQDEKRINRIAELVAEFEETNDNLDTNRRLEELVGRFGHESVALASGLKVSSILLYISRKNPPPVSERTVKRAEWVLNQL